MCGRKDDPDSPLVNGSGAVLNSDIKKPCEEVFTLAHQLYLDAVDPTVTHVASLTSATEYCETQWPLYMGKGKGSLNVFIDIVYSDIHMY